MKPTTPTLYWGPILQTGCVIIIAIDIDVHAIENHFQNLARTFVTPLGDFGHLRTKSETVTGRKRISNACLEHVC